MNEQFLAFLDVAASKAPFWTALLCLVLAVGQWINFSEVPSKLSDFVDRLLIGAFSFQLLQAAFLSLSRTPTGHAWFMKTVKAEESFPAACFVLAVATSVLVFIVSTFVQWFFRFVVFVLAFYCIWVLQSGDLTWQSPIVLGAIAVFFFAAYKRDTLYVWAKIFTRSLIISTILVASAFAIDSDLSVVTDDLVHLNSCTEDVMCLVHFFTMIGAILLRMAIAFALRRRRKALRRERRHKKKDDNEEAEARAEESPTRESSRTPPPRARSNSVSSHSSDDSGSEGSAAGESDSSSGGEDNDISDASDRPSDAAVPAPAAVAADT